MNLAPLQCSYILNSVRFRTDSNSVRKTNLKKFNKIFRTELDSVRKQKTIFKPRKNSEPNPIRFGKSSIILEEKILAKTSFCGEWNLEFGSNTTTFFHQLKNMWNLSQILTDFEKSENLKFEPNSHRFVQFEPNSTDFEC